MGKDALGGLDKVGVGSSEDPGCLWIWMQLGT